MSTIYYSRLKIFFTAISEHERHVRALQRLTKIELDHVGHVDRIRDKNFTRSHSELKIFVCSVGDELIREAAMVQLLPAEQRREDPLIVTFDSVEREH